MINEEEGQRALNILQSLEPCGIGARNLSECLIIQLRHKYILDDMLKEIVLNYLEYVAENKYAYISRKLRISQKKVQVYVNYIKSLEPKPSRGFYTGNDVKMIIPDAYIFKYYDKYEVILNNSIIPKLSVNSLYKEFAIKNSDNEEVQYIKSKIVTANALINSIEKRNNTLLNLLKCIVEIQKEYFEKGDLYLKPMVLKDVAREINVHESTVSRTIKEKYILTDWGIVRIKDLFSKVCPKSLELAPNFIAIKEKYNEDNNDENVIDSLKPFDKSQDMECSEEYSTTVLAKEKKTKYLFVPGCTVPAYSPGLIEKTLAHLRDTLDGEVGAMIQCCGKVTKLIGEPVKFKERNKKAVEEINETNADLIITICPSCYNVYSSTTDKKVISYWDLMKESIGIPENQKNIGLDSDVIFNIHDSCVTRNVSSHHESVRWIIEELGYKYSEIERSKGNTRCCGVGGMVCSSNPELYEKVYNRRAGDFNSEHIISYCGSCRGTMEAGGKDSLHILNLLHGGIYTKEQAQKRGYKSEEEMWANRLESKKRLDNMK